MKKSFSFTESGARAQFYTHIQSSIDERLVVELSSGTAQREGLGGL